MESRWKSAEIGKNFIETVRGAIPLAKTQIDIILRIIEKWNPNPKKVLDLGCGDGILGAFILEKYSRTELTSVDFSETMLEAARKRLKDSNSQILSADFSSKNWVDSVYGNKYDVIVSGFAIHHQPDNRKKEIYEEIYNLLNPGGLFLNLEHVESASTSIEDIADDLFIDSLYNYHLGRDSEESKDVIAKKFYSRPDKAENILATVNDQCNWLSEIGFIDVDCYFKIFELAIFGGKKRESI